MRVVILTGSELRHMYFCSRMLRDSRFEVVKIFCEGVELSLKNRMIKNENTSQIELWHSHAREQRESDFFGESIEQLLQGKFIQLPKGDINSHCVVEAVTSENPDILVCFGSSIVRSDLLTLFSRRFINVHLGLSPYYRGSGANVWPLINAEPQFVGATFMHINHGIDSGEIIHQIQADIVWGDGPHDIGNRLIRKMTTVYADIVAKFAKLTTELQPQALGKLYLRKDFDEQACRRLYDNFREGLVENYLTSNDHFNVPLIVTNAGLVAQ